MLNILLAFLFCFAVGVTSAPIIIRWAKKSKSGQTILHYVEAHKTKEGTPTMGGLIFLLALTLAAMVFLRDNSLLAVITVATTLAYGLLGFLDDFIKVRFKQNLGLRAYQKLAGQIGISAIIAFFVYSSNLVGSTLYVPFTLIEFDIGWFIIPVVMFIYLALTNSANLTDGLDGLAGGVSFVAVLGFLGVILITGGQALSEEYANLAVMSGAMAGGLLAFLCFNSHPAKIFMGDTGSLSLGAFIASIAVFTHQILLLPFVCVVFVISAASVIIQVLYFKKTKGKRIFLMSPLHHHFEKKGVHETKIVAIYIVTTVIATVGVLALLLTVSGSL
ncbi:MAG: phospho-N-acetylmuramoyl-pentapeptide-transferase [Firmicutes bacterium]|nr:phospho-N-acetylmuramoyl-pentapeptide-transferase [Bacillota bacterium]